MEKEKKKYEPAVIGNKFLNGSGSVDDSFLKAVKLIGIYFGQFSDACKPFTKKLTTFYKEVNKNSKQLEIIYASSDKDEDGFKKHYSEMPWLAFSYNNPIIDDLKKKNRIPGNPALIVLRPDLTLIFTDGINKVSLTKTSNCFLNWIREGNVQLLERVTIKAPVLPDNPKKIILKYLGDDQFQASTSGTYTHKPKKFNKDVYVMQEKPYKGNYWTLYWYIKKYPQKGSWRLTLVKDKEGDGVASDADPKSRYLGYGAFFPQFLIPVSLKFTNSKNVEYIIKFE